ncbi:hypothetical protein [Brachybacterium sp. SW0106-09]|uniref:hypothetical protein n=1 Tax=Brachybacterium sp. SW0106-09 TaxID=1704590 RepID=UPI0006B68DC0|nr:hypothetical protein [Brachybacterium sp. SW0106-09]
MAQYTNLNAPPERSLREIIDEKIQTRGSATGAAGVKDLGLSGDVVWPRPDGTAVSVRDVDLDIADARQRIEDAEGDLAGAKTRIDTALDAEGHIREDEILRNATLLGETVVQEINVTDKLVGKDGAFTGTVDFANVNVTGELLAKEMSGEYLYGTVIEGGEIRTGSDESRGSFTLGDRAYIYPHDGYAAPGIRFTPAGSTMIHPPGLGILGDQLALSGGKSESGNTSTLNVRSSGLAATVTTPAGSAEKVNSFTANNSGVGLQSRVTDGSESATVRSALSQVVGGSKIPGYATIQAAAGGVSSSIEVRQNGEAIVKSGGTVDRSLVVDTSGTWVTTNRSGVTESWNLEETASDTGWRTFPMNSALAGAGSPAYRIKSGTVFLRGSVTLPGASWSGGWTTIGVLPAAATPTFNVQRPTITSAMSQVPETYLQTNTSGQFQVWIPRSVAGTTVIQLSPMSYVAG